MFVKKEDHYELVWNPKMGPHFPEVNTLFLLRESFKLEFEDLLEIYDGLKIDDLVVVVEAVELESTGWDKIKPESAATVVAVYKVVAISDAVKQGLSVIALEVNV
jgi:hypothetical protein